MTRSRLGGTRARQGCAEGFTLIEVLVTLALLASLASAVLPLQVHGQRRQQEHELRHALRAIRSAIDAYHDSVVAGRLAGNPGESPYPPDLAILASPLTDRSAATPMPWQLLRRIPRDPMCHCPDQSPEASWHIVKDTSGHVYDVRSMSRQPGLNGVSYDEW